MSKSRTQTSTEENQIQKSLRRFLVSGERGEIYSGSPAEPDHNSRSALLAEMPRMQSVTQMLRAERGKNPYTSWERLYVAGRSVVPSLYKLTGQHVDDNCRVRLDG
jgi:hypothetical protein